MSSTTERTRKPRLTREILENENVFFYDKVHSKEELLEWLQPIRHEMKRARTEIPECSRKQFKKEINEFQYSGQDGETALASKWSLKPRHYHSEERFNESISAAETEILNVLDHCRKVRKKAIDLRRDKVLEPRWTSLLKAEFFKPYAEVHDAEDKHRNLFYRWELHEDYTWNGCPSRRALKNPVRTEPKPDLAYLFPIIDPACNMARVLHLDPRVENFTLPVLSELRKTKEVISSPTTTLLNRHPTKLGASDLACFPWAVIEVKHGTWKDDSAEFCYCQAANGSAEALIIREELAAKVHDPNNDALVIFSFTCVGPSVRLWLTYRHPTTEEIEMRCIWATSLELTWGVWALREVVANMRDWVFDRVKPEICRWISRVRSDSKPRPVLDLGGNQIQRRRRAKSMEPRDKRSPSPPSLPIRPASHSKVPSAYVRETTASRYSRSPSPSSRRSAPPMSPSDEEEDEDEDEDEDEGVLEAYESDADEDYVPSDDASGDDDGYTTVEEELYDTSEDEDEADEGYSSDRPFKALNQAEFLLRIRGRKSICC